MKKCLIGHFDVLKVYQGQFNIYKLYDKQYTKNQVGKLTT